MANILVIKKTKVVLVKKKAVVEKIEKIGHNDIIWVFTKHNSQKQRNYAIS